MDGFEPALGVFFGPQFSQFWGVRILRDGRILGFQIFHPHLVDSTGRSPPRWCQSSGKIFQTWDSTWWHLRNSSNFSEKIWDFESILRCGTKTTGDSSSLNCWWGCFWYFLIPKQFQSFFFGSPLNHHHYIWATKKNLWIVVVYMTGILI